LKRSRIRPGSRGSEGGVGWRPWRLGSRALSSDRYAEAGVDYSLLDAFKREALAAAARSVGALRGRGGEPVAGAGGAPAFVFRFADRYLALVAEGLGTKSLIAAAMEGELGQAAWRAVAIDTVAAIVGDLCAVGALPLALNAYFAVASSELLAGPRGAALVEGWLRGCELAGCAWGGGESPALGGLITPGGLELAGAAVGAVPPGVQPVLGLDLGPGDEIVLIGSSGLHANGASLARQVAEELPDGYRTRLPSGRSFGEALLEPSLIYVPLVERLLVEGPRPTYLAHLTGHGFLKLMRPPQRLRYRLTTLPEVPEVLGFLARAAGLSDVEAYRTLNMGAGFAVYVRAGEGAQVVAAAERLGFRALVAGRVEEGDRSVVLEPLGVLYRGEELSLAPAGNDQGD
jgi:phosphoribosylformylglycinamidine cyclo-ligase